MTFEDVLRALVDDPARHPRPVGTRPVNVVGDPEAVLRQRRTDRQEDSGYEQDSREEEGRRAPSEHAYEHVRKVTQRAATPQRLGSRGQFQHTVQAHPPILPLYTSET